MKTNIIESGKKLLDKCGPEILTGAALVLGIGAIVETIRKAKEATKVSEEYDKEIEENREKPEALQKNEKSIKVEKVIHLALVYKWAGLFGIGSAACMIFSTKLSGSKIAAAYALAKLNEDKLKIAGEKIKEALGEDKANELKAKIVGDFAAKRPENDDIPFTQDTAEINPDKIPDNAEIFVESYTGTMFETTRDDIQAAYAMAQNYIRNYGSLSFNKWRSMLGLVDCPAGVNVGWNSGKNPFKVHFMNTTVGTRKVIAICYENDPDSDYYYTK